MQRSSLFAAAALAALAACSRAPESPTSAAQPTTAQSARVAADAHGGHTRANNGELTVEQKQAVAEVRNVTTRVHDIVAAHAAGYNDQFPKGCARSEEGAQAYHWINWDLVDDKVELLRPELLMYEPQPNGSRQLIGVDYVVPFDKWTSPNPPTLLGVEFMRNEPLKVWALHIWAWRPNPSGMFAAWNPKVSCKHEDPA